VSVSDPGTGTGPIARFFPPSNGFGTYPVTASVTDPAGASSSKILVIDVAPVNDSPKQPEITGPADQSQNVSGPVQFDWVAEDPDRDDSFTYDFRLGTQQAFLNTQAESLAEPMFTVAEVLPETEYFWQGVSKDSEGETVESPIWSFQTAADQVPPVVEVGPNFVEATETTAALFWRTDEPADSRVRLGLQPDLSDSTDFPEQVIGDLVSIHNVTVTDLLPGTLYYYRTVSSDAAGNQVQTDIQSFTTSGSPPVPDPPEPQADLGDIDGDRDVDFDDFSLFASAFGSASGDTSYLEKADLNSDGKVAFDDFLIYAPLFGTNYTTDTSAP